MMGSISVEVEGGARLFCRGEETRGVKIGSRVAVENVESVFYFSHMGYADTFDVITAVAAVEMVLKGMGHSVTLGRGVGVAQEILLSKS